jgi:hypothetical protein
MTTQDRRKFLLRAGRLAAAGALAGTVAPALASEHGEHHEHAGPPAARPGFATPASVTARCATCSYWGGVRRISEDGKTVMSESLGWCNNPKSHHYGQLTTPETGPMDSWKKWEALS